MSARALATNSVNLGQGFPDVDGPRGDRRGRRRRGAGRQGQPVPARHRHPRAAAARWHAHQRRFYGLGYDPDTEVLITAGATEAIAAALLALLEPGDEVIAFEPYYDSYVANIAMAGATRVPLTLRPPDFRPDLAELESLITGKTRLLLLNSPHNPTGMVLTRAETEAIARIAIDHDLLVDHRRGLRAPHVRPPSTSRSPPSTACASRIVSIGSAGKTFSFTGWKVGWATATPDLVSAVRTTKQFLTYVSSGPFQYAVAQALDLPDSYFTDMAADLKAKRDLHGRRACGRSASRSTSPTARTSSPPTSRRSASGTRWSSAWPCPDRAGVVAIPSAVFYDDHPEEGRTHGPLRVLQAPRGAQGGAQPPLRPRPLKGQDRSIPNGRCWPTPTGQTVGLGPWPASGRGGHHGSHDDTRQFAAGAPGQRLRANWPALLLPLVGRVLGCSGSMTTGPGCCCHRGRRVAFRRGRRRRRPRSRRSRCSPTAPTAVPVAHSLLTLRQHASDRASTGSVHAGGRHARRLRVRACSRGLLFLAAGVWLLAATGAPGGGAVRRARARSCAGRAASPKTVPPLLLLPVLFLWEELFAQSPLVRRPGRRGRCSGSRSRSAASSLVRRRPRVAAARRGRGLSLLGSSGPCSSGWTVLVYAGVQWLWRAAGWLLWRRAERATRGCTAPVRCEPGSPGWLAGPRASCCSRPAACSRPGC